MERNARGGELLVAVLPASGKVVTLEVDGGKLAADALDPLLTLAQQGYATVFLALLFFFCLCITFAVLCIHLFSVLLLVVTY